MAKAPLKRPALSRERILSVALALVDREGLEAISMRRVGEELGVEAMSLYHHVASKAAILDGVFEAVLAELPTPKAARSWRAVLRARGLELRAVLRRHPNVLPLFATRPAVTPGALEHVETVLGTLREAGFSAVAALSALQVLSAFVVGHTLAAYAPRPADQGSRPDYASLEPEKFSRVREAAGLLAQHDVEQELEWGLDVLLTGLEAQL